MTTPGAFDSLCFTDCRDGEGVAPGSGFGFRAISPGTVPATMRLVQEACLYEPPTVWMDQQRPVAQYPRSLAHVGEGGHYATASGRYLGIEVKGSLREGNHFTHAIATDVAESFGQVRPAQLWASPLWRDAAGPGPEWPAVPAPPQQGPLDAETVQRWVARQPRGEAMLLAVCSALERVRGGGPRLLFIADDPQQVLAWIAAATLLMPRSDALAVGFKVFARDAGTGPHDVVALHVDWAAPFRGAGGRAFRVFDLAAGTHPDGPAADAAAFWVPRFLRRECFDVLDAVELSGLFRTGAVPGPAERVAAAALALDEPVPGHQLDLVLGWLERSGGATLPGRRRRELLDRLLGAEPDAAQLRVLAGLAERLDEPAVRNRVRWQVFAREVGAASPGAGRVPEPRDAGDATEALQDRLEVAAPDEVAPLLALAATYGLVPDAAAFAGGLRRFARWWADGALDVPDVGTWACRTVVEDLVREELAARLRQAPEASRRAVGQLWWQRLGHTVRDPRSDLDATLAAAAMLHGDDAVRREVTTAVLGALDGAADPDALDVAWRALYVLHRPAPEQIASLLRRIGPEAIPSAGVRESVSDALAAVGEPTSAVLDVLLLLAERGLEPRDERLVSWQRQAVAVRRVTGVLAEWGPGPGEADEVAAAAVARDLGAIRVEVIRADAPVVTAALAACGAAVGSAVLVAVPPSRRAPLTGYLEQRLDPARTGAADVRLVALAVALTSRTVEADKDLAQRLRRLLGEIGRAMDGVDRALVGDLLGARAQEEWQVLCASRRPRRLRLARWAGPRSRGPGR